MDEAKKKRTNQAHKVTRKVNEIGTAIKGKIHVSEIKEKISTLKYCMEDLGTLHDEYMDLLDDQTQHDVLAAEEKWFTGYDAKTNQAIKEARDYILHIESGTNGGEKSKSVKLKKLEVPKFSGDSKDYYKWKNVYERFTKDCDEETKYDYLLTSTSGEARKYVENKTTYSEAMTRLDEKYGNIHIIMGMLINEVKSLQIVRKGGFRAFEQLSLKVDEFYDRLKLMGKESDVENSYVLKEIEGKLSYEDAQKWLESMGDQVDVRKVEDLMKWLERQTHLRRITYNDHGTSRNPPPPGTNRRTVGSTSVNSCAGCLSSDHCLAECPEFLQLDNNGRWERVMYLRVCFVCLKSGHRREECTEPHCNTCSRPHHIVLHRTVSAPSRVASSPASTNESDPLVLSRSFLPIVRVVAHSNQKQKMCIVALDSLSEINIISSRCAQQLGLTGKPFNLKIEGAGGVSTVMKTQIVEVSVADRSGESHKIGCVVLSKACGRAVKLDTQLIDEYGVKTLKDKNIYTDGGEIDILIGMSKPDLHKQFSLEHFINNLYIMETKFGYCLVGTNSNKQMRYEQGEYSVNAISLMHDNPDELMWRNHLQAEMAGINPLVEESKTDEEKHFDQRMKIDTVEEDGCQRLQVTLAWKFNPETFENNREEAVICDEKLIKQLNRNPAVCELFKKQFKEMVDMKVLRKVDKDVPKRYLPLLAATDLERESTKVRICLDAKRKFNGVSFNDYLLNGKLEMSDMFQSLTKFRAGEVAMQGDIRKMFWQIKLSEYDQQFHGVIHDGETYVFTRVCFGDKPSPTIADVCMRQISRAGKETLPLGASVIEQKRYVDDILDAGVESLDLEKKKSETSKLLGNFGFEIKEWLSNKKEIGKVKENGKVLGILWNGNRDELSVQIRIAQHISDFTKRNVLKVIAKIWDSLGLLCGLIVAGKLIFQSIVRMKPQWDEINEDGELAAKWQEWLTELGKCNGFCVPRSILPTKGNLKDMNWELIGCGDGSSVAYGCAVYLCWYDDDEQNVELKFIGAKGRLNPIKGTTVPRSELCGAVLVSKLVHSAECALKETDISEQCQDKILFSDSTTVLSWVKSASIKYKPFVKNKVMVCQELHSVNVWDYLPGRDNTAADLISKGCKFNDLDRIVKGPEVLYSPRKDWPRLQDQEENKEEIDMEKCAPTTNANPTAIEDDIIDVSQFSSWTSLLHVTGYVFKPFRKKPNSDVVGEEEVLPSLSDEEIQKAELYWIRKAQMNIDVNENKYQQLAPFKDADGIIRVEGRLKNMPVFDESRKYPILLPSAHPISLLITKEAHEKCLHPGHLRVMAEVRKRFWIVGLRTLAKGIGRKCVICRKWRGSALEQKMANLPSFRLNASSPFENTSIDYFGSFTMKYGYRGQTKAYGVVFSCLTTRAVHVELATDQSTDVFLLALRRFISLYGSPKFIRSDNGRNFLGAANELREMIAKWRQDTVERKKLVDFCNEHSIKWTFSTPTASHHNGAVESMVKTVKLSLSKLLKSQVYKEEEYRTIFAIVTLIVNSRPLWPASDGDLSQPPITCNDLSRPRGLPRDPVTMNVPSNPRKRYDHIQNVVNDWWRIWLRNFTPNLQCRSKWFKDRKNIDVGDIVLIIDTDVRRSEWSMGIVENVYRGDDERVRSVRVRTAAGSYDRPITKLCLLLSKDEQKETE